MPKRCKRTGKAKYPGKGAAQYGALHASRKTGKPMRAYPCEHCKAWHLTTMRR